MEAKGILLCSQEPAAGPCPQPEESKPHHPDSLKPHFNSILVSTPRSSEWSLPFKFYNKNFSRIFRLPMRDVSCLHITVAYFIASSDKIPFFKASEGKYDAPISNHVNNASKCIRRNSPTMKLGQSGRYLNRIPECLSRRAVSKMRLGTFHTTVKNILYPSPIVVRRS
jgi:hypothetical protein